MSRIEFINELEALLSDIPDEERKEALQYYNDYFEDAGEEQEEQIIKELGTPNQIAASIRADLGSNSEQHKTRGYFTEKGYHDPFIHDDKFELVDATEDTREKETKSDQRYYQETKQQYQQDQNNHSNSTATWVIILICIFASPLLFSVAGVIFSFLAAIFCFVLAFGLSGIVMSIIGIVLFVIGILKLGIPLVGLMFIGSGLFIFGLGIIFVLLGVSIAKTVVPVLIRGVVNVCRLPFKNRSVAV